jgi:hypothetical protein
LGQLSFRVWGRQPKSRERAHGRDRREQLPVTASDQEGISKDLLFFEEAIQPSKSVCYGFLLHQLWFCLRTHHTSWITTKIHFREFLYDFALKRNKLLEIRGSFKTAGLGGAFVSSS